MHTNRLLWSVVSILMFAAMEQPVFADQGCLDFKWDVSKERALFAGPAQSVTAGKDPASAPAVVTSRLVKLTLTPQDQVIFAAAPGKKAPGTGAYAGLIALKIPAPGSYRIALDQPTWIDVASNGALVPAKDFEGQHACAAPHKIVEFDLAGMQPFIVQFSGAPNDTVLVTITPSPQRKF